MTYDEMRQELVALHAKIVERGEKLEGFDCWLLNVTAYGNKFTFVARGQEEVAVRFFTNFGGFTQSVDSDITVGNADAWIRLFNDSAPVVRR
jgi:hypothetical protein